MKEPWQLADDPQAIKMRRRPLVHEVRFAESGGVCKTLEGWVRYKRGDAIVTGVKEEHWSVSRKAFEQRYEALSQCPMGESGRYRKRPIDVLARLLDKPMTLFLAERDSILSGKPGDWLVQYAPDDWGVVRDDIFQLSYEAAEEAEAAASAQGRTQ